MSCSIDSENLLRELASALAAIGDHTTAIALRKLARVGYTSLKQVDEASDWILLSISGIGVKRLSAVRALTRPKWQPPSSQAIQITSWYLSALRFALRFWSPDTLASVIRGSGVEVNTQEPIESRLAMDAFVHATHDAMAYCDAEELFRLLQQGGNGHLKSASLGFLTSDSGAAPCEATVNDCGGPTLPTKKASTFLRAEDSAVETDRYAYPRQKRREIISHYRMARKSGQVRNKEAWAQAHYCISGRTLFNYEREFPETDC
jgi:hypothetical protein